MFIQLICSLLVASYLPLAYGAAFNSGCNGTFAILSYRVFEFQMGQKNAFPAGVYVVTPAYDVESGVVDTDGYICWKCDGTLRKMVSVKKDATEHKNCESGNSAKRICFFPPGDDAYQGTDTFGTGRNCAGQVLPVRA